MRGRFAPSPTGDLHLGGAYVALAAWLRVRARGGGFVVRMEDLDRPRVVAGAADRILDDLQWLGVEWDEGPRVGGPDAPYEQSKRSARYDAAIDALDARGLVYPCTCSRAEIARASSAPHAGEEGPRYPGTCRDPSNRKEGRAPSIRLRVPDDERAVVEFVDEVAGRWREDVGERVGDFVLRRADGVSSYQLAVVVDDAAMRVDEVVRGDDLLPSTARQILLGRLLDLRVPSYAHLPLVLGPDGARLSKRQQSSVIGTTLAELRAMGVSAEEVRSELRAALGPDLRPARPWKVPARWIRPRA